MPNEFDDPLSVLTEIDSRNRADGLDPEDPMSVLGELDRRNKADALEEERRQLEVEQEQSTLGKTAVQAGLGIGEGGGGLVKTAGVLVEEGVDNPIRRTLNRGMQWATRAAGKLPSPIRQAAAIVNPAGAFLAKTADLQSRPETTEEIKEIGQGIRQKGEAIEQEYSDLRQGVGGGFVSQTAGDLSNMFVQTAPSLAAAMTPAGITGAATVAGTQSFGQMLDTGINNLQRRNPDLSRDEAASQARPAAALAGLITGGLTRYFQGGTERIAENIGKMILNRELTASTLKSGLGAAVKEMALEVPEEVLDTVAQDVIEYVATNPDKTWEEVRKNILMSAIGAVFMSGLASTAQSGARALLGRRQRTAPSAAQEPPPLPPSTQVQPPPVPDQVPTVTQDAPTEATPRIQPEVEVQFRDESGVAKRGVVQEVRTGPKTMATVLLEDGTTADVQASKLDPNFDPNTITATPNTGARGTVDTRNLKLIAQDQLARLNAIAEGGPLSTSMEERRQRLAGMIGEGPLTASQATSLAALFEVKIDETATQLPESFRHLEGVTNATQEGQQQEGNRQQRGRDAQVLPQQRDDRPDQAQESGARAEDSSGSSVQQRATQPGETTAPPIQLTGRQANIYRGGTVVTRQNDSRPLEVIEDSGESYVVRDLTTNKRFAINKQTVVTRRGVRASRERQRQAQGKVGKTGRKQKQRERRGYEDWWGNVLTKSQGPLNPAPSDTQVDEGALDAGGVSAAAPKDPRERFIIQILMDRLALTKQRFPSLHINNINYFRGDGSDPTIYTSPTRDGFETMNVDVVELFYQLKDMNPQQIARYFDAALEEEMFHNASGLAIHNDWIRDGGRERTGMDFAEYYAYRHELMFKSMSAEDIRSVMQTYGLTEDQHVQIAAERARQILQDQASGKTTEELVGAPFIDFFRSLLNQLRVMLAEVKSGRMRNAMLEHVNDVQSLLDQQTVVVARLASKGRNPEKLGALVPDPESAEWQSVAFPSMTPSQIREVETVNMAQNEVTCGHARAQWEGLDPEIQAHMPWIDKRFQTIDYYAERLEGQMAPGEPLSKRLASMPQEWRAAALKDALDNMHQARGQRTLMDTKLAKARDAMKSKREDPPKDLIWRKGSHLGLVDKMFSAWRNELISRRKSGTAPAGAVNTTLAELKSRVDSKSAVLERIAKALFINPDPDALDPKALGVSRQEFDSLSPMVQFFGADRINEFIDRKLSKDKELVEQIEGAIQFLDNSVFGDPLFEENYRYAVDAFGVETEMLTGSLYEETMQHPDDPEKRWQWKWDSEVGADQESRQQMIDAAVFIREWISRPGIDPTKRDNYRRHLDLIEQVYLNPQFDLGQAEGEGTPGKLMLHEVNLWNSIAFASGGRFSTMEYRIEAVGSRASNLAMFDLRNLVQSTGVIHQIINTWRSKVQNPAGVAMESHGLTQEAWLEEICNPVLACMQETAAARYNIGDMVNGHKITREDWNAIQIQKDFINAGHARLKDQETKQNEVRPVKINDRDQIIPIWRYAGETGPMTMPRRTSRKSYDAIEEWRDTRRLNQEKKLARWRKFLDAVDAPYFQTLVISHMRSVSRIPSYGKAIKSPFVSQYRELNRMHDNADRNRPRRLSDVLDYIESNQSGEPDKWLKREEIESRIIFTEIAHTLGRLDNVSIENKAELESGKSGSIVRSDNWLNKPRGEQVGMDSMYSYHAVTKSDMSDILHAVFQVHGQRVVDSLNIAIEDIKSQIRRMKGTLGITGRGEIRKKTLQDQKDGVELFNLQEAEYNLNRLQYTANQLTQALGGGKADFFGEELHTFSRSIRRTLASGVLSAIHIVHRNLMGGALKVAQMSQNMAQVNRRMWMNGNYGWNLAALVINKTVTVPADMIVGMGKGLMRGVTANGYLASKVMGNIPANVNLDMWNFWAGGFLKMIKESAGRYERLRQAGYTGHSEFGATMKNYLLFKWTGGQFTGEDRGAWRKAAGLMESALGALWETGIPNFNPRGLVTQSFENASNMLGMQAADKKINNCKLCATEFLTQREGLGLLPHTVRLTPQELEGNSAATDKDAAMTRRVFSKAGINVDAKMLAYHQKIEKARDEGTPLDRIPFLTPAEYNSFSMVMAEEVNRGTIANRPEIFQKNEMARWFSLFMGYGAWASTKFATARARFSRSSKSKGATTGNIRIANMLWATLLAALTSGLMTEALLMFLYGERRQQRNLSSAKGPKENFDAVMDRMAPFLGFEVGLFNTVVNPIGRPGAGLGRFGVQLVPQTLMNEVVSTTREIVHTGEVVDPVVQFIVQHNANAKVLTRQFPFYDGMIRYRNTLKSLRGNAPKHMQQTSMISPGIFVPKGYAPNVNHLIYALAKSGDIDWDTVDRERDLGVENLIKGYEDADKDPPTYTEAQRDFDKLILDRVSFMGAFRDKPTQEDRDDLLSRLSPEQREELEDVEGRFLDYASRFGRTLDLVERPAKSKGLDVSSGGRLDGSPSSLRSLPSAPRRPF